MSGSDLKPNELLLLLEFHAEEFTGLVQTKNSSPDALAAKAQRLLDLIQLYRNARAVGKQQQSDSDPTSEF